MGSDDEDEQDAEVDLEGELLSVLDELKNARNELKDYTKLVHEECSKLRTYLEDSNKKVSLLTTQLNKEKRMENDFNSILDSKERRCEELLLDMKSKEKGCQDLNSEMENLKNEYKLFRNVAVVEKKWLIRCLEVSEKCTSELKTQKKDTKECKCKDLKAKLETKDKEHQKIIGEMESLWKELEKCQDKLKLRKKYDGGIEALDNMLSQ